MLNELALFEALLATIVFAPFLIIMRYDEPCDVCGHSRWQHGDKVCTGLDHAAGSNINTSRACNCDQFREEGWRKKGSGHAKR